MTPVATQALAAAAYQSAHGPRFPGPNLGAGQCMMRTRILYGAPAIGDYDGDGAADAEDGWKYAKLKHPTTDPATIPAGVPVWWGGGSHDNGHVGASAGGGMCWSTDIRRPGMFDFVPISEIGQKWGLPLLGWTEDIDGVQVYDGTTTTPEVPNVTTFLADVSHYQGDNGLTIADLETQGYEAVIAKCTEGSTYADPHYAAFLAQARKAKFPFMAYHYLHHGSADKQAAWLAAHILDKSIPVMIDAEKGGGPTWKDITAFIAGCEKRGLTVALNYLPRSWWEQIGKPSLVGTPPIVNAAYPSSRGGFGSVLYPGNGHADWAPYGGVTPLVWQFTSTGKLSGVGGTVDIDAFRGPASDLVALFKTWDAPKPAPSPKPAPTPNLPEDEVTPADIEAIAQAVLKAEVPNATPGSKVKTKGSVSGMLTNIEFSQEQLAQRTNTRLDTVDAKIDALTALLQQAVDAGK